MRAAMARQGVEERVGRRIAALLLMEPELDASYQAIKAAPFPWPLS